MNFDDLVELAKLEAKGRATETEVGLLSQDKDVWIAALQSAIIDADSQIQDRKERLETEATRTKEGLTTQAWYEVEKTQFEAWGRKMHKYRNGLLARVEMVEMLKAKETNLLLVAIKKHRDEIDEPTRADVELWATAEQYEATSSA